MAKCHIYSKKRKRLKSLEFHLALPNLHHCASGFPLCSSTHQSKKREDEFQLIGGSQDEMQFVSFCCHFPHNKIKKMLRQRNFFLELRNVGRFPSAPLFYRNDTDIL